jgi:hypothetical protein
MQWHECRGIERACQCATVMAARKPEADRATEALHDIATPVHAQKHMEDPAAHQKVPLVGDVNTAAHGSYGRARRAEPRAGESLSDAALAKLFPRWYCAVGLHEPWMTPHALRHTHATRLWEDAMRALLRQKRPRISSKVIVDPPLPWRLGQGRATSVEVGSLWNAHREYTRRMEGWQEKLHRAAGAMVLGREKAAKMVSEEREWPVALGHLHALSPERLRCGSSPHAAAVRAAYPPTSAGITQLHTPAVPRPPASELSSGIQRPGIPRLGAQHVSPRALIASPGLIMRASVP